MPATTRPILNLLSLGTAPRPPHVPTLVELSPLRAYLVRLPPHPQALPHVAYIHGAQRPRSQHRRTRGCPSDPVSTPVIPIPNLEDCSSELGELDEDIFA